MSESADGEFKFIDQEFDILIHLCIDHLFVVFSSFYFDCLNGRIVPYRLTPMKIAFFVF